MIDQLKQFYDDNGELVVTYEPRQEELYRKATNELWEVARSWGLKHHSYELEKARNEIQRKYHKDGLLLDLFSLPNGIHKGEGNFSAMLVKHFLQTQGFNVLVSEEDYYLMWERGHHYENEGFSIISKMFGAKKVEELLRRAPQGGDPDVFAFLDRRPEQAWFIEAKRQNENPTKKQIQNFPYIRELLCPVEIARIVPFPGACQETGTHVLKEIKVKQNAKPTHYKIGKYDGYNERPTTFKYYLLSYRQREHLAIEALSQEAMDSMIRWLASGRKQMERLSDSLNIPLPRNIAVQFEDRITEVNISDEKDV